MELEYEFDGKPYVCDVDPTEEDVVEYLMPGNIEYGTPAERQKMAEGARKALANVVRDFPAIYNLLVESAHFAEFMEGRYEERAYRAYEEESK